MLVVKIAVKNQKSDIKQILSVVGMLFCIEYKCTYTQRLCQEEKIKNPRIKRGGWGERKRNRGRSCTQTDACARTHADIYPHMYGI